MLRGEIDRTEDEGPRLRKEKCRVLAGNHSGWLYSRARNGGGAVAIFSRCVFEAVRWASRKGLREEGDEEAAERMQARKTGVRGETYAYWYLRRHGYIFVARNYMPHGMKGEIDLVGYDGKTLAFVEVRTRTVRDEGLAALPELSVTTDKQRAVVRTAQRFLAERHVRDCACRFDVLAIDNRPGSTPEVRLHKDAFSPQI